MKKIVLVTHNGIGNLGGVERVCYYLNVILSAKFRIEILAKPNVSFGKLNILVFSLIDTLKLLFQRNKFVISNSWQLFSYSSDLSIHHGTTKGCIKHIPGFNCFSAMVISFLEKISAKKAKHILSVSKNCTEELINLYGIPSCKITTLNNFVDGNLFYPKKERKVNKECVICFSGRICTRKGLDSLLKLSEYIEKVDGVKLLIACNDKQNIELFSENKKTEIRTGLSINDMNDFYNLGDIFYFPTLYEGFSMSTLEALSCGLPVLGTKFAIPDEIAHYDFCKRTEDLSPSEIVDTAINLRNQFKNKRVEIHEIVDRDFGKNQYSDKLFNLILNLQGVKN